MSASLHHNNPRLQSDPYFLRRLESLFIRALKEKAFSGAAILIGTPQRIIFESTWGATRVGGKLIDQHTAFDLASLTKPLVTAPLCIWLISRGEFDLEDPLEKFFPLSGLPIEKRGITIRHLLNHCSGLPPYAPFYLDLITLPFPQRRINLVSRILDTPLLSPPGTTSHYSDLGFILLGAIVEDVTGKPLHKLSSEILFSHTDEQLHFCHLQPSNDPTVPPNLVVRVSHSYAATEFCPWRDRLLEGEVHDENAFCLGGTAGHAGLFGTARGVYRMLSFLWDLYLGIRLDPFWSSDVIKSFWTKQMLDPESSWALGFDTPSICHSSAGVFFSPQSIGHLGFTGTSFWIDLDKELMVVLLTNRVYPSRKNEKLKAFRPLVHNLIMEAYDGISTF